MAHESIIVNLIGLINGVNKVFSTPVQYRAGTLKVILNGQVYESDDDKWGWVETSVDSIELITPPRTNDVLQAFLQEKDPVITDDVVIGSPFHPTGLYP